MVINQMVSDGQGSARALDMAHYEHSIWWADHISYNNHRV
jgi:hypothetical protein